MKKIISVALVLAMTVACFNVYGLGKIQIETASEWENEIPTNELYETNEKAKAFGENVITENVDENYGIHLLSQDFEQDSATQGSYSFLNSDVVSSFKANGADKCNVSVNADSDGNHSLMLAANASGLTSAWRFMKMNMATSLYGDFYISYKVKADNTVTTNHFARFNTTSSAYKQANSVADGGEVNADTYTNWHANVTTTAPIISFGINVSAALQDGSTTQYVQNTLYFDDIDIYVYPSNAFVLKVGENTVMQVCESSDEIYTFPTPSEMGLDGFDNTFVKWMDNDNPTVTYNACDTATVSDIAKHTFTAYLQDKTQPSMGMAFEGVNDAANYNISSYEGSQGFITDGVVMGSNINDGGRYVRKLFHANGNQGDARLKFYAANAFDAREYNIVSAVYKIEGSVTKGTATYYYMHSSKTISGNEKYSQSYSPNGEYQTVEFNISDKTAAYTGTQIPYEYADKDYKVYGFALDPCWSKLEWTLYVDSFRVYRNGITGVTYKTNDGTDSTFFTETGRGVGTGYVLYGGIPENPGKTFIGWSLTPDGEVVSNNTIDLAGDTTLYAVWENLAPTSIDACSIRSKGVAQGLRFAAYVSDEYKEKASQYGFISALETNLGSDYTALEFDESVGILPSGTTKEGVKYVSGTSFVRDENGNVQTDIVYSQDGTSFNMTEIGTYFTAVLYGIPHTKEAYNSVFVVRSFLVKDGFIYYGTPVSRSIYEVAISIEATDFAGLDDEQIAYITDIILTAEG